jgi:inorganic pyrophosphatase
MNPLEYIGKIVSVTVDRQMGSRHPKHGFVYPLNYGYLEGVISGDGEDLDAYIVGVFEPVVNFTGKVIAVIMREDEDDPKLIIAPEDKDYSNEAILALTEFQERFFKGHIERQ